MLARTRWGVSVGKSKINQRDTVSEAIPVRYSEALLAILADVIRRLSKQSTCLPKDIPPYSVFSDPFKAGCGLLLLLTSLEDHRNGVRDLSIDCDDETGQS